MATPFTAPAVMPHSPDGNISYEIMKYVLSQPELSRRVGIGEPDRLMFTASEENAQLFWQNYNAAAAATGESRALADLGIPVNHLTVPDLSAVDGPVPPDPKGTPFFVPAVPVDDPAGGVSYDRFKSLIANPETRAMLGLDDKTASWIMRSEEGAFLWYQQALANENQSAAFRQQEAIKQVEAHLADGFNYAKGAGVLAVVCLLCFLLFLAFR